MMKLFGYEMEKLLSKRWLFLLLGMLLLICVIAFLQTNQTDEAMQEQNQLYEKEVSRYSELPLDTAANEISSKLSEYERMIEVFAAYSANQSTDDDLSVEDAAFFLKIQQMYGDDPSRLFFEKEVYDQLQSDIKHLTQYNDWLKEIDTRAEQMLSVSAFAKKDTFSYRNIQKTPGDYAHLKGIHLSLGTSKGILHVCNFFAADFAMIAAILLFAFALFVQERENGTLMLVQSCRDGRAVLGTAKLFAFFICTICMAAILYGGILFLGNLLYGYGDTSRLIQSIPAFKESNLLLRISDFLLLFFGGKILASLLCGGILLLIIVLIPNVIIGFSAAAGVIGCSYSAYWLIPPLSTWNLIKFVNPIAFLDVYRLLAQYHNLNLFGFPVTRSDTWLWMLLGILLIVSVLTVIVFASSNAKSSAKHPLEWLLTRMRRIVPARWGVCSVWYHEHIKLYGMAKMAAALIVCIFIASQSMASMYVSEFSPEGLYIKELKQVEGAIDEQTDLYFETRKEALTLAQENAEELLTSLKAGTISAAEYQTLSAPYQMLDAEKSTYDRLFMQYTRAKELNEQGQKGGIVNELSAQWIFSHKTRDLMIGIWTSLFLTVGTVLLFTREYKYHMLPLLRTTYCGKGRLFAVKTFTAAGFSALVLLIFSIPFYCSMANGYSFADMNVSLQNITQYASSEISLQINSALVIRQAAMFLAAFCLMSFCIWISVVIKRSSICIVVGATAGILPIALEFASIPVFRCLTIANAYTLFSSWNTKSGIWLSFAGLLLLFILSIIFLYAAYHRFCAAKRRLFSWNFRFNR